jgi:hypothetical protein
MANKPIPLVVQEFVLRDYFPEGKISRLGRHSISWEHTVKPSPISRAYRLRLTFSWDKGVKIFVIDPKPLELPAGKFKLPHVYSTPKQQLCLYYPVLREWDPGMYYVHTMIPWACEWLIHYELWLGNGGTWLGGGIDHENTAEYEQEIQDIIH